MNLERFANEYETTLVGAIDDNDTSLVVASATGAPGARFRIRIDDEFLLVTAVSGTTFTVERGVEGSTPASHVNSSVVTHILTAEGLTTSIQGWGASDPNTRLVIHDECFWRGTTGVYDGAITPTVSGTGAATNDSFAEVSPANGIRVHRPGQISLTTGTTTTGRSMLLQSGSTPTGGKLGIGAGPVRFGTILRLGQVSDGTNTFKILAGFNLSNTTEASDCILFRYSHNINSGNWQAFVNDPTGNSTINSSVPASTTTYQKLEFQVDRRATSVEFFIDEVSIGVITDITEYQFYSIMPVGIFKSAGTSARTVTIDAYWTIIDFDDLR